MFECQGYKWKLVLYPNGNIVNGQISLYLKPKKAVSHPKKSLFEISFELFVFDNNTGSAISKKAEYHGKVNFEIGFRNLINLKEFKDSANGYLVNDSCKFGVKILHIVPIQTPQECLYPVEKVSNEHTLKITKFSRLEYVYEHWRKFTAGDHIWFISIYPKGDKKSKNSVSLYLGYRGSIHDTPTMNVSAEYSLSIIDQVKGKHIKFTGNKVFKSFDSGWGWRNFMPLSNFNDLKQGFLNNDTCIIEVKVTINALVK